MGRIISINTIRPEGTFRACIYFVTHQLLLRSKKNFYSSVKNILSGHLWFI